MTPAGGWSSKRGFELTTRFGAWVTQDGAGTAFDSSAEVSSSPTGPSALPTLPQEACSEKLIAPQTSES